MFGKCLWEVYGPVRVWSVLVEMGGWEGALRQFDAAWTMNFGQLAGDRREKVT